MKKILLLVSVLLSCVMFFSCGKDDERKEIVEPIEPSDPPLMIVISNHPGTVHLDEDLDMWYILYSRVKSTGISERLYVEDLDGDMELEGLSVVFSGEANVFSAQKGNKLIGECDYHLVVKDIAICDHFQRVSEIAHEITAFFDEATSDEQLHSQFAFPDNTPEEKYADTCFVINSNAQLEAFYTGELTIPNIDFDKYTLIIGKAYMPNTGESLVYHDISADKKVQNLYVETYSAGSAMISMEYYWGLYPKFDSDNLISRRFLTKLTYE
jgi:hypothetical protein